MSNTCRKEKHRASLGAFIRETRTLTSYPRIESCGRSGIFLDGCRKILKYSPESVILLVKGGSVEIGGEGLICTSYHAGNVSVEGRIASVNFRDGEAEE